MTLVKIDRSTVRANPNAGATDTSIALAKEAHVTVDTNILPAETVESHGTTWKMTRYSAAMDAYDCAFEAQYMATGKPDPIPTKGDKWPKGVVTEVCVIQRTQTVSHAPEPDFFFEYIPTEVTCDSCGASFDHSELAADSDDDGNYSATICPHCNTWDCTEIEYERLA